jgi:hypothetical protein
MVWCRIIISPLSKREVMNVNDGSPGYNILLYPGYMNVMNIVQDMPYAIW